MKDASHWAFPYQLRQLFVTLLLFCEVKAPLKLLEEYVKVMGKDMAYRAKQLAPEAPHVIIQQHIRSYVLQELKKLLSDAGYSLDHFNLPHPDESSSEILINRLIMEELSYASDDALAEGNEFIAQLNSEQRHL